jgi:EAL domain-containing protein (putative c-di-GMP-specific phosphodiesterase class I)
MQTTQKQASIPDADSRREAGHDAVEQIQHVIDEVLFAMHFQPIVDLCSHKVFANEALCRPQGDIFKSPVELIKAAVEATKIGELGRLQRALAVKNCSDSALFLNLEPHEFDEPWLVRPDDPIFMHRKPVYLEITENVPIKYFEQCHSVLAELRKKGNFLAIDDFGAGFSNLKYIAELEPDIVKLDRELIQGCRIGTSQFSLLQSITALCHEMNARVVAEGIETPEELSAVLAAGADFGQGYLLARPAAEPPAIEWPATLPLDEASLPKADHHPEDSPSAEPVAQRDNKHEAHLQDEVKKLTDLLVQSEVARLTLVRRLNDSSDTDSDAPLDGESPLANVPKVEPSGRRPAEPPDALEDGPLDVPEEEPDFDPGAAFSITEEPSRFPRLALVIPLLAVLIIAVWVFWPSSGNRVEVATLPNHSAALSTGVARPLSTREIEGQDAAEIVAEMPAAKSSDLPGATSEEPTVTTPEPQAEISTPAVDPIPEAESSEDVAAETQIAGRVDAWAEAWSGKRSDDYLSFYSVSFQTPSGESFGVWADSRRQRLARPAWINVVVSHREISIPEPNRAIAKFNQAYSSPGYSDEVIKTQEWTFEYGAWHILSESSAPVS